MNERMVDLVTMANDPEARYIASLLEAQGIRCQVGPAPTLAGSISGYTGASAPHVVRVMESDYDTGQAIINAAKEESIDIDWDEIDVGLPEDETARRIAEKQDE